MSISSVNDRPLAVSAMDMNLDIELAGGHLEMHTIINTTATITTTPTTGIDSSMNNVVSPSLLPSYNSRVQSNIMTTTNMDGGMVYEGHQQGTINPIYTSSVTTDNSNNLN